MWEAVPSSVREAEATTVASFIFKDTGSRTTVSVSWLSDGIPMLRVYSPYPRIEQSRVALPAFMFSNVVIPSSSVSDQISYGEIFTNTPATGVLSAEEIVRTVNVLLSEEALSSLSRPETLRVIQVRTRPNAVKRNPLIDFDSFPNFIRQIPVMIGHFLIFLDFKTFFQ